MVYSMPSNLPTSLIKFILNKIIFRIINTTAQPVSCSYPQFIRNGFKNIAKQTQGVSKFPSHRIN